MSQLKIKDGNSWVAIPAGGVGVPSGGDAGDVLVKSSSTDYATEWETPEPQYCTYSSYTDISSYNSSSNYFTAPCDGYLYMSAYQRTGSITILSASGTNNLQFSVGASGDITNRNLVFVRKGTRAFISQTSNASYFIPLDSFYS